MVRSAVAHGAVQTRSRGKSIGLIHDLVHGAAPSLSMNDSSISMEEL